MLKLFLTSRRPHKDPKFPVPISRLGGCITTLAGVTQHDIQPSPPTDNKATMKSVINLREQTGLTAAKSRTSYHWPEWVTFVGKLAEEGYIEHNPLGDGDLDAKYSNKIRTACLNFARHRFDFIRYFSSKDLKAMVTPGCPSLDRKVVNSGKRLRAHLGIDERSVCRSCFFREICKRAYVKPLEDEDALTVDVMRILLTYGFYSITKPVEHKPCLNKEVEESARRLITEMVEYRLLKADSDSCNPSPGWSSSIRQILIPQRKDQNSIPIRHGDWICPKCSFINFARNIKCLSCNGLSEERLKNLGEHQDHLPLKKGDWLCDKCHFLNFAKNTRCLQCKEMPPKRALNPGEWECDSCNFINFRKNMICLKCDYRRLKTSKAASYSTRLLNGDGSYSADYETCHSLEETGHGYFVRQGQSLDAGRWKLCDDEKKGGDSLNPLRENCMVSKSPILRGQYVLSRDVHEYERRRRRRKDGTTSKSNQVKAVPDVKNINIMADTTTLECSELADDDNVSSWFRRRRKS
ncbi:unnamed protein product [Rhodiola kirilowii]